MAVMTPENVKTFAGLTVNTNLTAKGWCLGLYGKPGIGKTSTAAAIAYSEHAGKLFYGDAEAGVGTIRHLVEQGLVDPYDLLAWREIDKLTNEVERAPVGSLPYGTFVFDNMTEIQALCLKDIVPSGDVQIQHHGTCTRRMLEFTRRWRSISNKHGVNVIFCIWEETEKHEATGIWRQHLYLTPKLAAAWPGVVQMVGLIDIVRNRPEYRKISFTASAATDSKFGVAPTDRANKIPTELYFKRDEPVLADMLNIIRGTSDWDTSKYSNPARQQAQ